MKMADAAKRVEKNIRQITVCSICMIEFTDPRMLPCIHTYCFACIKRIVETAKKRPGDKMPCPLCRKKFTIPREGVVGLQNNFFMENLIQSLLELKTTMQSNDPMQNIGMETEEETTRVTSVKCCSKHTQRPLDYYCADCKKIVCVSCLLESHKLHDCKDVNSVDKEFSQTIEKKALKISDLMNKMLILRNDSEKRKAEFLKALFEKEKEINNRKLELKDLIDQHTQSLLDELSLIKGKHLKIMETQMEEIERRCTILSNFEAYCTELRLKGSASDICSSVDQLFGRADELETDHEAFIGRPHQSVEVSFRAADLSEILQKFDNLVGNIKEMTTRFENCAFVMGLSDGETTTKDVIKINLHHPNEISTDEQLPVAMMGEAFASVSSNTMYVTGIGTNDDEIWKYGEDLGWKKCASLVQCRIRHSAAFVDEELFICGGFGRFNGSVLDSVEAYNAVDDKCSIVGKLIHCVLSSGNCVPFKSSLYIFGGLDKDNKELNDVQVYNTKQNTCTLLSKPMPHGNYLMQAVLWDTSVIFFGYDTCLIYNIDAETWQERNQFKTDVDYFGLVLENGRIFVIGGGIDEKDKDGKTIWKCRDDVRYVPLRNIIDDKPINWKIHGRLSQPSLVFAYAKMTFEFIVKYTNNTRLTRRPGFPGTVPIFC